MLVIGSVLELSLSATREEYEIVLLFFGEYEKHEVICEWKAWVVNWGCLRLLKVIETTLNALNNGNHP